MKKKKTPRPNRLTKNDPVQNQKTPGAMPQAANSLAQKWMHADDVLIVFRVCRRTLYNYRLTKKLVASKVGGKIFFDVAAVEACLFENRESH